MQSRNSLFSGTYPLISSYPWSFFMQICYMRAYFSSPYLSHIVFKKNTCLIKYKLKVKGSVYIVMKVRITKFK